jgi:ribosomal protein L37AE/L43A
MSRARQDPLYSKKCCGRYLNATWDDRGGGIWKCRRCGKTPGRRPYADLAYRKRKPPGRMP